MKKSTQLYAIFLFAGLLYSCSEAETKSLIPPKGEVIPVKVQALQKGSFSTPITTSGNFTTKNETTLSFKVGGIVSKVYVQEGEQVKKGPKFNQA